MFRFLVDLAANNNRKWFQTNKGRYEGSVVEPVTGFIVAMGERLAGISKHFVADPRPHGGSMFRIYRDTRFSKDKRPYKENVGCHFRHSAGRDAHSLGFYLHLQPDNVFIGAGVWKPSGPALDKIRTAIVGRPGAWKAVSGDRKIIKRFGSIDGESLKRPPRGYDADSPFVEDLKRKSHFVGQQVDPKLARSPKFIGEVNRAFTDAAPLMKFLAKALELRY